MSLAALSALAGCSLMNPYDHAPIKEPVERDGLVLAGDAKEGLDLAEQMRQTYYDNLRFTSYIRSGAGATAGVLSGWALYNALKPDGSGTAAADGDVRRGVRLGAALGTLYGLRQSFVNPDIESVHAEGYRSMTCLMVGSSALLMTEATKKPVPDAAWPNADAFLKSLATPGLGDLDRLRLALDHLERRILELSLEVARQRTLADAVAGSDDDVRAAQKHLRDQLRQSVQALVYARTALAEGRLLVHTVQSSGREIKQRVGLIVATVNDLAQQKQNNLPKASDALKDAQDVTSSIMNIGSGTAADQTGMASDTNSSMPGNPQQGKVLLAGPMSAAAGFFGGIVAGQIAANQPAARAAQPAASSASAATSRAAKPAVTAASAGSGQSAKPKPVAVKPKEAPPTSEELSAIRDKLDVAIKAMAARKAEAEKKAAQDAFDKALAAKEARIADLARKLSDKAPVCATAADKAGCGGDLAKLTEELYAVRRPVVHALLEFRRKARVVAATPECAELAPLRVVPNESVQAKGGDTVSFVISQRALGTPLAVVQGPINDESGLKFSFIPVEGSNPSLFKAVIQVGPKMVRQHVKLIVSDSRGRASQTVTILAGEDAAELQKKKKEEEAKAKAKAAEAAASAAKTSS